MPKLVLDLDLTVFIEESELIKYGYRIHFSHTLLKVEKLATLNNSLVEVTIHLINPVELAKIIELACSIYDGLIILTSGFWDLGVRDLLADNLNLSETAKAEVRSCSFHSVMIDAELFELPLLEVQKMPKGKRLEMIIKHYQLDQEHFVLLDDSLTHFRSCKNMKNVSPILATPCFRGTDYYKETIRSLHEAKKKEEAEEKEQIFMFDSGYEVTFFPSGEKQKIYDVKAETTHIPLEPGCSR